MKPTISIIVTVYNGAKYLPKCLDALLEQTFPDIEIICVDDASSDNSATIITEYAENDKRIVPILKSENHGVSAARNSGLAQARGEYIMFCDSDDYYDPEMCDKLLHASKTPVDLVACEVNVIYHAHQEMKLSDDNYYTLKFNGLKVINDEIILKTDLSPTNKLFRKDLIDQYQLRFPEGLLYEDAYFCAAYLCLSKTAYFLPEKLYNYIRHANSTMSNTWTTSHNIEDRAIDHLLIAFKLYDFLEQHQLLDTHTQVFWQLFLQFENFSIRNSKTRANARKVRKTAAEFIKTHQTSFAQADSETQHRIKRSTMSRYMPSPDKVKQVLLKFMPTYRLRSENLNQLRNLSMQNQQLLNRINELKSQENHEQN